MIRPWRILVGALLPFLYARSIIAEPAATRIVILKIDGLNADLLNRLISEQNPATERSRLPWMTHIFRENGTVFENFYVRGISLSAPSWSMLDTGRHTVIRGNVEYDRYTGRIYDYLNFFPFYLNYARKVQVDMPGVEVLDRAGIPLVIDAFPYEREFQSFQLFQRGVRWATLKAVLKRRVKSQFLSPVESVAPTSLNDLLEQQTEAELTDALKNPAVLYLDFYTGDIDHEGHATNRLPALADTLQHIDALAGRIWTHIQNGPEAGRTIFVVVSDHGMNNRPEVFSESFSLPDFFNSPTGGGHHVITNRHQLSDFKLMGLDPMVQRVITPTQASYYLSGESSRYPTVWLDLDGNERASVHLRNSDLNRIHILLQQLSRKDLTPTLRKAAADYVSELIRSHRDAWSATIQKLSAELEALKTSIEERKDEVGETPHKWTTDEHDRGEDKVARRLKRDLSWWERESTAYHSYIAHLKALLDFRPDPERPFTGSLARLVPEMSLGDNNHIEDLQGYAVGPGPTGLVLGSDGKLDPGRSFRTINYFPLLLSQTVRNNPQASLPPHPIDFIGLRLPDEALAEEAGAQHGYWLYAGQDAQMVVLTDPAGNLTLRAVAHLRSDARGKVAWDNASFKGGLPLRLFEDPELVVPAGSDRSAWLCDWHSEREWLLATHRCRYSNGVIGIVEEMSPVGENVPGSPQLSPILLSYERRRRELVQPDFQIFASDGWNFNARNFNPGGNHGAFFRISTHSVWMMAGAGIPVRSVAEPYDSLNFASTILTLAGKPAPDPARVVRLR